MDANSEYKTIESAVDTNPSDNKSLNDAPLLVTESEMKAWVKEVRNQTPLLQEDAEVSRYTIRVEEKNYLGTTTIYFYPSFSLFNQADSIRSPRPT